jgi:phenylpropionate dioxygenase-like ring-hydroxylating dioxygenase large terminal subunit
VSEETETQIAPGADAPERWFAIARTEELGPLGVLAKRAFDRNIAVWRDAEGEAHVVDATCPHVGANLGHGTVRDGGLACPIHGWRWGPDGKCMPFQPGGRAPDAPTRVYRAREEAGEVLMWWEGA